MKLNAQSLNSYEITLHPAKRTSSTLKLRDVRDIVQIT